MILEKDYYFNEESLDRFEDKVCALQAMEDFVHAAAALSQYGFGLLRHDEKVSLSNFELYEGYHVYNWKNDDTVSKEIRTRFKSIETQAPLINDESLKDSMRNSDVYFNDKRCIGLTAAYIDDSITISFNSNETWNNAFLSATVLSIDSEEEVEKKVEIRNITFVKHCLDHISWIKENVVWPKILHSMPLPFVKISSRLTGDVYNQTTSMSTDEKIAVYKQTSRIVALLNFSIENSRLTEENKRLVFEIGKGRSKLYLALDTQHGTFECHDSQGNHKGEFNFKGEYIKLSSHKLIVE